LVTIATFKHKNSDKTISWDREISYEIHSQETGICFLNHFSFFKYFENISNISFQTVMLKRQEGVFGTVKV